MTGVQSLTVDIPPDEWLTSNMRLHWAKKAARTRALRRRAWAEARAAHLHHVDRAHVTAWITYPTGGRADPANTAPTVKAIIDGLTDAGVWDDDDARHLVGPDFRRAGGTMRSLWGANNRPGWHRVALFIDPLDKP